ncbi:hypothetical protein NX794_03465 [Streptomyces sp. LP11]|uniref:Flp pilus assembly protein RcpC/CpaB domain-containing protein n=1 Tax=Streptomyces pyxinicus TaxID=2970331 RepID=A0ABT2AVM1_9ACTN|nr:hypothetical protein [Streptomyces sp. LP11]MCS0600297.1 hypothetical protein [Streptomyces sp. LP11]
MILPSSSPTPSSLPSLSEPPGRSAFSPPLRLPRPLGTDAPATCEVPRFPPVRVRGGRYRLQRLVRHRGRALAAGLAVTAAALVAAGPRAGTEPHRAERVRGHPVAEPVRRPAVPDVVTAPVRIADAATVRLLRAGDRVDVIAAEDPASGGGARVLARGARVTRVPAPVEGSVESGALVALSVPRATAARLVGASATARLAVTLC